MCVWVFFFLPCPLRLPVPLSLLAVLDNLQGLSTQVPLYCLGHQAVPVRNISLSTWLANRYTTGCMTCGPPLAFTIISTRVTNLLPLVLLSLCLFVCLLFFCIGGATAHKIASHSLKKHIQTFVPGSPGGPFEPGMPSSPCFA